MKKWLLLIVASLMLVVAGCGDKEEEKEEPKNEQEDEDKEKNAEEDKEDEEKTDEEIEKEVEKVVYDNIDYTNDEDVEGYLKAIPTEYQEETREQVEEMYAAGNIAYEILEHDFVSVSEDEVVIDVIQSTEAADEETQFDDNISEIRHTLRPEDGEWKIYETEVRNMEPTGGEATGEVDEDIAEEALDVLYENLDYANDADLDGYLKAIPEEAQEETKAGMEELFAEVDIEFGMLDYEVVVATEDEVQIYVLQTTVAKEETDLMDDNISEMLHTLNKEDGEWKIFSTEIVNMEPYEEE